MNDILFIDEFDVPDGIITNEYAYSHPRHLGIHESSNWVATSGTLFARAGQAYSGVPDGAEHGSTIDSTPENGSAVLRVITKRISYTNIAVKFSFTNIRFVTTNRTPEKAWNGLHVFMRRQDENNTYYIDVNRIDGTLHIKRKLLGAYVTLSEPVKYPIPMGVKQDIEVRARTLPTGAVELRAYIDGNLLQHVVDDSGDRILAGGSVGIRGDNCEFALDDFQVLSLGDL